MWVYTLYINSFLCAVQTCDIHVHYMNSKSESVSLHLGHSKIQNLWEYTNFYRFRLHNLLFPISPIHFYSFFHNVIPCQVPVLNFIFHYTTNDHGESLEWCNFLLSMGFLDLKKINHNVAELWQDGKILPIHTTKQSKDRFHKPLIAN